MRKSGPENDSAAAVLQDLDTLASIACDACRKPLCGHEALMSRLLGFRAEPRCWPCLAAAVGQPLHDLRDHAQKQALQRDHYRAAWEEASRREGCPDLLLPACLYAAAPPAGKAAAGAARADAEWDAGAMRCGDLVLELRRRFRDLPPGAVIRVRATDPGAPVDLPVWCGMTGHTLLEAKPPQYVLRKRAR